VISRDEALALERIEAAAWRDLHAAATPEDREALGLQSSELAGAWMMGMSKHESLLHNRVIGLGLDEPASGAVLDTMLARFRDLPHAFAVNLAPFALPATLEHQLAERGFGTFFHHLKWVRGAAAAPAVGGALRVEPVRVADAAAWGAVASQVFGSTSAHAAWASRAVGRPGWSHYFARAGALPVAVAAMYVRDGDAWLGAAATLESHRRQGAQSALFARRIADALKFGARRMTLETAPDWPDLPGDSLRNAARAGFHPAYERPSWIWPLPH
jgi:GNAT superfamily N-acetyltransferase